MHVRSGVFRLLHPEFKAARIALAAGAVAGLAVLGACADTPTASQVAGPEAPSSPSYGPGVVGDFHHKIAVCVDVASDPAPTAAGYTYTTVKAPVLVAGFSQPATINVEAGYSTSANLEAADVITTPVSLTPGNCAEVFVRQTTNNTFFSGINPRAKMLITATVPAGYTSELSAASCINEGFAFWADCYSRDDAAILSANIFHGGQVIFLFKAPEALACPAGSFVVSTADAVNEPGWPDGGVGDLLIKYDQFPAPNDNSYGANAVGWPSPRGHKFKDLVNSDHAGVQIRNASNQVVLSFNMDYLSAFAGTPSGYKSLGVTGGDGGMLIGTATGISVTTSLASNLNTTGYCSAGNCTVAGTNLLVDSPPTDALHQTYVIASSAHALWDFHNTYYARISAAKLSAMGFNAATWTVQPNAAALHNSPEKACPDTN